MGTDTQVGRTIGALAGGSPSARRRASRGGSERGRRGHREPHARRPSRLHRRAGTDGPLALAVTTTPTADLSTPQLEVALRTLAGHLNAATCRFLVLLSEFDTREGWAMDGIGSCAHWLTWRCSLTGGAAREHVRVANAIRDLPQIRAAFAAGQLSYSKVRALTRLATPDREADLLQIALVTPSGPLERYLRGLRGSLDAESEAHRHANRQVTWRWAEDGSLTLTARLSTEDGALVVEALEATAAKLLADAAGALPVEEPFDPDRGPFQDRYDVPAGTSTARARADALLMICTQTGDATDTDEPNPTRRPELIVHVNLTDLTEATTPAPVAPTPNTAPASSTAPRSDTESRSESDLRSEPEPEAESVPLAGSGSGSVVESTPSANSTTDASDLLRHLDGPRIQDGPALLNETARRLACDARIVVAIDGPSGETLDLGRAARFPNAALTRALWHRDGACQYPGCDRRRFLVAHHILHWADGGLTTLINCCLLCTAHHRALHEGGYQLTRTPKGDLLFTSRRGATITPAPTQSGNPTGATTSHRATITPDTTTPNWYGDRLDVSLAVEATRSNWDDHTSNAAARRDNDRGLNNAATNDRGANPDNNANAASDDGEDRQAAANAPKLPPAWAALFAENPAWLH